VLGTAFGPVCSAADELDPEAVLDIADRLDLASRIGALHDQLLVASRIGHAAAAELRERSRATAGVGLKARALAAKIGRIAAENGIQCVIAKGGALLLSEAVAPGLRNVGDLDVLVARSNAERLQAALVDAGWHQADLPGSRHQMPILGHPAGLATEVHLILPGVRIGEAEATIEDVLEGGFAERVEGLPEGCFIAGRDVLLAHLLVHGLHQHGFAPRCYPVFRMFADVQDLIGTNDNWGAFLDRALVWIEREVSRREVDAVWAVVEQLSKPGGLAETINGASDPGLLLRHVIAGTSDREYQEALVIRNRKLKASESSWWETGRKIIFPTRGQLERFYGKPKTELGYLGLRVLRPFDATRLAAKYGWAWTKQKFRRS
jgi:hypothetical protein